jgi:HAMP domain-containing protein
MLAAMPFMLVFRFLHIVAGVLWVGSAFLFVGFIGPSAAEVGPSAGPLLTAAVKKRKVVKVIVGLGATNVLAGWVLWLRNLDLYGSFGDWVGSRFGLVITIGAVLATISLFVGAIGVGRNVERLVDLGNEVAASGGPPSAEQQTRIGQLTSALERHGKLDLVLLLLATIAMATARYW